MALVDGVSLVENELGVEVGDVVVDKFDRVSWPLVQNYSVLQVHQFVLELNIVIV